MQSLSIVLPVKNEHKTISLLIDQICSVVSDSVNFEIIIVDDSDTLIDIRTLPRNLHLRHYKGKNSGLSSAIHYGLTLARNEWAVVMDSDLQHPPTSLRDLVKSNFNNPVDIVIFSRFKNNAGFSIPIPWHRRVLAIAARLSAILILRHRSSLSDPMSGFFAVNLSTIKLPQPSDGFKYLLDLLFHNRHCEIQEFEYNMQPRYDGSSKLGFLTLVNAVSQLTRLGFRTLFPIST